MKATHVKYNFPPTALLIPATLAGMAAGLDEATLALLALPLIIHPAHSTPDDLWPRVLEARLRQLKDEGAAGCLAKMTWAEVITMFSDFADEGGSIGDGVTRAYSYAFIQEFEAAGEGDKIAPSMREEAARLGEYELLDLEGMRGRLRQKQLEAYRKVSKQGGAAMPISTRLAELVRLLESEEVEP